MDITRELKTLVSTGKVFFGFNQAIKAIEDKKAKLIILASNCKKENLQEIKEMPNVKTFNFDGTNVELGAACGKPFSISVLTVVEEGDSSIMDLI
jgi:large subunit ribosomal protein L30e